MQDEPEADESKDGVSKSKGSQDISNSIAVAVIEVLSVILILI